MWASEESAIKAAKKSHRIKDFGSFIIVHYPQENDYAYFLDEEEAKRNGRAGAYDLVGRYKRRGLLGFKKLDPAQS